MRKTPLYSRNENEDDDASRRHPSQTCEQTTGIFLPSFQGRVEVDESHQYASSAISPLHLHPCACGRRGIEADIREEGQAVCPYTNTFVKYRLGDSEVRLWD